MQQLTSLFGHLHPLLVHLPIGILLLAFLFELLSRTHKYRKLKSSVASALLVGAFFAILSCITGYFLSQEESYDDQLVQLHQWMGITTAIFSILVYGIRQSSFLLAKAKRKKVAFILFVPLVILISYTGHLGGSLTHGEDYLFDLSTGSEEVDYRSTLKKIENMDEAIFYQDLIHPILEEKCFFCHSSKKQKGQLRLDQVEFIQKGGKHGVVFYAGLPDSSAIYSRLMLPVEDKHHMPPEEKSQLASAEITLIQTWISEGASFEKKISELKEAKKIKKYIEVLLAESVKENLLPIEEVKPADSKAINEVQASGALVMPVASKTNYLMVSFINTDSITPENLTLLLPLKEQLAWLRFSNANLDDDGLKIISQLQILSRLSIDHTKVTDEGLVYLENLFQLKYLNLVGTKVSDKGLEHLQKIENLQHLFLFQTEITADGLSQFIKDRPTISIDTGGYRLPSLPSDTVIYKKKI